MLPATTSPFCQYLHDFMQTCEKFEEIYQLSKNSINNLLKEKSKITAFNYLKNEKIRQTKIMENWKCKNICWMVTETETFKYNF